MSLIRFNLDLAIPPVVFNNIPSARKAALRALKALAVRINAGQFYEEMSVKASWHVCRHDEGEPCDPEQDI